MSPLLRVPLGTAVFLGWMSVAFGPEPAAPSPLDLPSPVEEGDAPAPIVLNAVALQDGPALAMPTQIAVIGNRVVLLDGTAEHPIHLLDAESGALLSSLGRNGEGPGEFEAPRTVDAADEAGGFWVYDAALSRLTLVEPERWATEPASSRVTVPVRAPAFALGLVRTADGMLATGFFADGRLGHFDQDGTYTGATGTLPVPEVEAPPGVIQQAYRGTLKADPSRERLVLANRNAGLLEVFAADGSTVHRIEGPVSFEPMFEVAVGESGPTPATGDGLRFGYTDVAPTTDRIYALFSGRTRADYPDGDALYGSTVHVFGWDGSLVAELDLGLDAFAIAVDEDRGRLLAVRHLPTPAVVSFDLPDSAT